MDFLVRIFFSGLIAFVPSTDGKELTVLLLETHAAHSMSDGTTVPQHIPMLLARAQSCSGDCNQRDPVIAQVLFSDRPASQALDSLDVALDGGGAWTLDDVDISVRQPGGGDPPMPPLFLQTSTRNGKPVPATSAEREDFGWVPNLKQVLPSFGTLNPALFGARPPKSIVAARLRLKSGRVFTHRLIRVDGKVVPLHFRALASKRDTAYVQAAAGWVAADIRVPGDSVEVVAQSFDGGAERSMKLAPRDGLVEMAILNLPPVVLPSPAEKRIAPLPGRHFEMFYSLAEKPAAAKQRPVPLVRAPRVTADFDALHPPDAVASPLLEKLRLESGRSTYDIVLCPVGQAGRP